MITVITKTLVYKELSVYPSWRVECGEKEGWEGGGKEEREGGRDRAVSGSTIYK